MPRKHAYVSFTDRVAAIRIDPIRRSERKRNTPDSGVSDSYFISALEKWNDLNLASQYSTFAYKCSPLVQTLPMLIYNQNEVFELLIENIETTDEHSAEPFFDLLVCLARDLGEDFEQHYPLALKACVDVIERTQRNLDLLSLVELAFSCLAHMFKYLSRLLTTNLIPTYDAVLPLFGGDDKKQQRDYVLRFAAESIAFLVRRAQGESLVSIVEHIVQKVAGVPENAQYLTSCTQLFAATLQGPGETLHSKAQTLLTLYLDLSYKYGTVDLMCQTLVASLHHTRRETAGVLYETTVAFIKSHSSELSCRLLFVLAGHRKGDRVSEWQALYDALTSVSERCDSVSWINAASAVMCYSDMGASTKNLKNVFQQVPVAVATRVLSVVHKVKPSILTSFDSIVWPIVLAKLNDTDENELERAALLIIDTGSRHKLKSDTLANTYISVDDAGSSLFQCWWRERISEIHPETGKRVLTELIQADFSSTSIALQALQSEAVGGLLGNFGMEKDVFRAISLPLQRGLLVAIRTAILRLQLDRQLVMRALGERLYDCLMSCDRDLRGAALHLFSILHESDVNSGFLIDQCMVVNDLPFDLENARNIGQRVRTLASQYASLGTTTESAKSIGKALLCFLFGMLTSRFQPVWTSILSTIPKLADKDAELVCDLAMRFISKPMPDNTTLDFHVMNMDLDVKRDDSPEYYNLDCNSLSSLEDIGYAEWLKFAAPKEPLQEKAREAIRLLHHDDLRILGIKVLRQIPKISERRLGPALVPFLLTVDTENDESEESDVNEFTYKDRVALMELFALFSRPEKLPQYPEIRAQYLNILASRHQPLQRLALKCLLTIKSSSEAQVVGKYRENLEALLDDSRFRDEITNFINVGAGEREEGSLHPDDREIVLPLIVRILYGRALLNSKRQLRQAVLSSLLFLEPRYRQQFVQLAQQQFASKDATRAELQPRKVQGYLTLLHDFVRRLKTSADSCIAIILDGGIFPILSRLELREDKLLRQLVTKALDELMANVPKYDIWLGAFPHVYDRLIGPQLIPEFGARNLSQPTSLMRLFLTLSTETGLIPFIDDSIATALVSCLEHVEANEAVVTLVLQVGLNMLTNAPDSASTKTYASGMLACLPSQMERQLSPDAFGLVIASLNKLCESGVDLFSAETVQLLVSASLKVLQQPTRVVPLPLKAPLLEALSRLLESSKCSNDLVLSAFQVLSPLFSEFYIKEARTFLCACYRAFGKRLPELSRVGNLVTELNSYDPKRLGIPDFDRRGAVFESINEEIYSELSELEWTPLVYNMLFFLRDPDEMALRVNSRYSLFRLLGSYPRSQLVQETVLPALRRGLRNTEEKFRKLYIDILRECAKQDILSDLRVLLFNGDEDRDFFINVVHVQVYSRRVALQTIGTVADKLEEDSIVNYLLPLIHHFVEFSGNKNNELNSLADDAMQAYTQLARHISVNQFKSLSRRQVQLTVSHPEPKELRKNVRLVISIAQATPQGTDEFVVRSLIAPLHHMLSSKANEHENLPDRIPIAVAIATFLKRLSEEALQTHLPGKLTSLCQLLRSKIPEMRDSVRRTLGRVIRILGPQYLKFLVTELRGALRRGGLQGHVLGYTVHSLLVELTRPMDNSGTSVLKLGDFDESAGLIFDIVIDDTFGSVGEEKEAEGYVTNAKEVKGNKGYDTAEMLAKWTSLSHFGRILSPLQEFLVSTRLTSKKEHKVEELLKHLATGLFKNPQSRTQDAIIMAYEIFASAEKVLSQGRKDDPADASSEKSVSSSLVAREEAARESEEFFTVRLSSRDWHQKGQSTYTRYSDANLHLLQSFSLDVMRSIVTYQNGLLNVANVKGLLPLVTKGLESKHEDMQIAALKFAANALRLPVPFSESDDTLAHCGNLSVELIKSSPRTNSEICQAALKLLTMLIRTKPEFEMSNSVIAYILDRLRPDLEEPELQGVAMAFTRAILTRKLMIPQVYEMAELLSELMVTNQTATIRDSCRAAYLQFLTTYPMSAAQFSRRLSNLGANLRYAAASGRLSVMDVIQVLLEKTRTDQVESAFLQWYANLVLVLVNDSDPQCRSAAAKILKIIISKASPPTLQQMLEYCVGWLKSVNKNNLLVRGGLEVAAILNALQMTGSEELQKQLQTTVREILRAGVKQETQASPAVEWQLLYLALDTHVMEFIDLVEGVLLFPHPWVRARAARVFGTYFKSTPPSDLDRSLLRAAGRKFVRQLAAPRLSTQDSLQIVKNLVFIIPLWDKEQASLDDESRTQCVDWLVRKLSGQVRNDASSADHVHGKTGAVQILAALPTLVSKETLLRVAYEAILGLYIIEDQLTFEDTLPELRDTAMEALGFYDRGMGTTEYLRRYTEVKQFVDSRRLERKAKRAVEVVTAPEVAAQKRMKRNANKRDVRRTKKARRH